MKRLMLFILGSAALILSSCGTGTYTQQYPNRYPDERNNGPVVLDRNGNVIGRDGGYDSRSGRVYRQDQRRSGYGSVPPRVINMNDRYARRTNSGQLYYTDRNGYVYWKGSDGYYHLDERNLNNRDRNYSGNYPNNNRY